MNSKAGSINTVGQMFRPVTTNASWEELNNIKTPLAAHNAVIFSIPVLSDESDRQNAGSIWITDNDGYLYCVTRDYESILNELANKATIDSVNSLKNTINSSINSLSSSLSSKTNSSDVYSKDEVDEKINNLRRSLETSIQFLDEKINNLSEYIENKLGPINNSSNS